MKYYWNIKDDNKVITIDFDSFEYEDVMAPLYLSGTFNNWNKCDEKFALQYPPNQGANILLPISIVLPMNVHEIEYKIWNNRFTGFTNRGGWIEPIVINENGIVVSEIYAGSTEFIRNAHGSYNVLHRI